MKNLLAIILLITSSMASAADDYWTLVGQSKFGPLYAAVSTFQVETFPEVGKLYTINTYIVSNLGNGASIMGIEPQLCTSETASGRVYAALQGEPFTKKKDNKIVKRNPKENADLVDYVCLIAKYHHL